MNFGTFWTKLQDLEKGIKITAPATLQVKRVFWGAPAGAINDLPAVINALSVSTRVLGFGSRQQDTRIMVQLLAARARPEDVRSAEIATAFWFAACNAFDADYTIGGTVPLAQLQGMEPTVPVILTHADMAFIGFQAFISLKDLEAFAF